MDMAHVSAYSVWRKPTTKNCFDEYKLINKHAKKIQLKKMTKPHTK